MAGAAPRRWLAVDYGSRWIGLALCDEREILASPLGVIASRNHPDGDAEAIVRQAQSASAGGIVIGLPLNMDGSDSEQTLLCRKLAEVVAARTPLPVELWDERLSSFEADALMSARPVPKARRKQQRNAIAAYVILRDFLAARRKEESPPA